MPQARRSESSAWTQNARGRLISTVAEVVSERGYAATRVSDVLERAKSSRRTFYVHFDNLEGCFFAAHDAIVADLVDALTVDRDPAALETALEQALSHFATRPAHARVLLIEVLSAGPSGVRRYEQTVGLIALRLTDCPRWQPGSCRSLDRRELAQATVGAILRIVQLTLLTRGGEALPGLVPSLLALTTGVRVAA